MTRPRLRTKTGCLTCRKRRKKCDEDGPACRACRQAGRLCQWPSPAQLLDRRFTVYSVPPRPSVPKLLLHETVLLVQPTMSQGLDAAMTRHFMDDFYWLLLLPDCHPDFMHGWITDMQHMMIKLPSLRYSILAAAAAHIHVVDVSPQMQQLALSYYAKALRELSALLSRDKDVLSVEENHGMLISIMLLYIQGCECTSTSTDIPKHVNAVARILASKFFTPQSDTATTGASRATIERPFDRLAIESVLYQIFIARAALWSDHKCSNDGDYQSNNTDFWAKAEALLATSKPLYPSMPHSINSPVLGIPIACFRLALTLKQYYQSGQLIDKAVLMQVRNEVNTLRRTILTPSPLPLSNDEQDQHHNRSKYSNNSMGVCYRDTGHLYILICDMLLDGLLSRKHDDHSEILAQGQVAAVGEAIVRYYNQDDKNSTSHGHQPPQSPVPVPSANTNVRHAIHILRRHQHDPRWSAFYVGDWAVYTLGVLLKDGGCNDHIGVVRQDMRARWERTGCGLVLRFCQDMEEVWAAC